MDIQFFNLNALKNRESSAVVLVIQNKSDANGELGCSSYNTGSEGFAPQVISLHFEYTERPYISRVLYILQVSP